MKDRKAAPRHPEADIQRDIVQWLRAVLPPGDLVHCSANEVRGGGARARMQQAVNVGMGVLPGFSDLLVLARGRILFLEVKSRAGTQSGPQRRFQETVEKHGHSYGLVRSVDDARAFLATQGVRTREKPLTGRPAQGGAS